jgi:hypothetical protein
MSFLFDLCILVGSQGILFGRCLFCCIYLFVNGVLIRSVLCFVCEMLFLFVCVSEKFRNFP